MALQGSGTADAPSLVIHLDASGRENIVVSYTLRDIDGSADDAVQSVALQYRLGDTGAFTNVPAAYVHDASEGGTAIKETLVNVTLPAAVNGAAQLQLRIMTTNAASNDEWIGIDDIQVSSSSAGPKLTYTGSINETAAFDGTVEGVITITLTGETFMGTDGQPLAGATVGNLPGGLFAIVTKISDTVAELRVTGTATGGHAIDVNNLTVTFADAAFAGNDAAAIANATKSDLKIDFATEGAAPVQEFRAKTGSNLNVSDASTAIALDANYMVVGDDEASVLRVFHREGGEALVEWDYSGLGLLDSGDRGLGLGLFGLDALLRDPALLRQFAVTLDLGVGQIGLGVRLGDGGGAGGDIGLFLLRLGVDIADGGDGGLQIGLGLGQVGALVRIVQLDQNVPGLDLLVVGDQNLGHAPRQLRGHIGGVGLDEGVVGRLPALAVDPPDRAADDQQHADDAGGDKGQAFLEFRRHENSPGEGAAF
mgnify:CR=1 FL=1